MSRETKFRGKRKDNGKEAKGYYVWNKFISKGYILSEHKSVLVEYEVDPATVGQFTGLKDKNGKDLDWWEDDLFNVCDTIRKIVFEDGCYWFKAVFPNKVVHQRLACINIINDLDILPDKIGNIHENPELLTKSTKGE